MSIADVFEAAGWVVIAAALGWLLALSVPAPFGVPCGVLLAGALLVLLAHVSDRLVPKGPAAREGGE